jgi:hypothetical protein
MDITCNKYVCEYKFEHTTRAEAELIIHEVMKDYKHKPYIIKEYEQCK